MNLEETSMGISFQVLPKLLYKQFCEKAGREPEKPFPVPRLDRQALDTIGSARLVWYGHSVLLMQMQGLNILIDPMLGPNASPIAPFKTRRFTDDALKVIDDFPEIDLLLLTHDHYDHLDLASMELLMPKVKQYFVALGCSRHLESWGINSEKIREFDWWDSQNFHGLQITFTPTRHFSGRGLKDRARSLWGGWVFKGENENIYFSGDGGYGKHFKEVGKRLGPFDFGLMECGQYNENWHLIHMYPEESVQAALDAGVKKVMAVHWAGFSLAQHAWKEPAERFYAEAKSKQLPVLAPAIGEVFSITDNETAPWWHAFD